MFAGTTLSSGSVIGSQNGQLTVAGSGNTAITSAFATTNNLLASLTKSDFHVFTADSAEAAQEIVQLTAIDLVLTDQRLPQMSGVQLLEWVRQHSPKTAFPRPLPGHP